MGFSAKLHPLHSLYCDYETGIWDKSLVVCGKSVVCLLLSFCCEWGCMNESEVLLSGWSGSCSGLTEFRIMTGGAQGNQIHSSVQWTLGIPKISLFIYVVLHLDWVDLEFYMKTKVVFRYSMLLYKLNFCLDVNQTKGSTWCVTIRVENWPFWLDQRLTIQLTS